MIVLFRGPAEIHARHTNYLPRYLPGGRCRLTRGQTIKRKKKGRDAPAMHRHVPLPSPLPGLRRAAPALQVKWHSVGCLPTFGHREAQRWSRFWVRQVAAMSAPPFSPCHASHITRHILYITYSRNWGWENCNNTQHRPGSANAGKRV